MAENWKNCFEEELICPICLHVFVEPVQLPCKHNFCRGCIGEAWAKETGLVRCPECNQAYNQKPNLEKNLKLTNIVEKFNSLNLEKTPSVLHCVFCRRGPPLPAQKICLRCEAPCCQSHVQTHLQQPSTARGHLLVEADDVRAWSCPQHNAYRLYHCEAEQVAVCQFCCYYSGAHQGHSVCDVEIRRNEIRVSGPRGVLGAVRDEPSTARLASALAKLGGLTGVLATALAWLLAPSPWRALPPRGQVAREVCPR